MYQYIKCKCLVVFLVEIFTVTWCVLAHIPTVLNSCLSLAGVQLDIVDGPLPSVGRVQITYDGVPGSICTEEWTDNDASLVRCSYYSHR